MAQMARHPSVHMTDITPAHTAATLRPDRHHTHGHQVAILGWRLYEAYRLRSFLSFTARPGRAVGKLRCWAHAPPMGACAQMLGVAWAWPGRAVDAQKANGVVCTSRRHQRVKVVESPARAGGPLNHLHLLATSSPKERNRSATAPFNQYGARGLGGAPELAQTEERGAPERARVI